MRFRNSNLLGRHDICIATALGRNGCASARPGWHSVAVETLVDYCLLCSTTPHGEHNPAPYGDRRDLPGRLFCVRIISAISCCRPSSRCSSGPLSCISWPATFSTSARRWPCPSSIHHAWPASASHFSCPVPYQSFLCPLCIICMHCTCTSMAITENHLIALCYYELRTTTSNKAEETFETVENLTEASGRTGY